MKKTKNLHCSNTIIDEENYSARSKTKGATKKKGTNRITSEYKEAAQLHQVVDNEDFSH